jgi:cytochrome c553
MTARGRVVKRIWKWAAIGLGAVAALALAALLVVYVRSDAIITKRYPVPASNLHASSDAQSIARGKHMAFAYGCADCHTHSLQGALIPDFGATSRNLTRLAATFSDADFDRAVRHGLRPDGTSVAEYMPSDSFRYMSDREMADIIAYIRSLTPSGADIPFPSYGWKARIGMLKGEAHMDQFWFGIQKPALSLGPKYETGRRLAMTACGECHMTPLTGAPAMVPPPRPPDLSIVASYERRDFLKLMHTGKAAGNRELPMMSAVARARFSHFSDDELDAIYDYLAARGRKLTGSAP